MLNLFFKPQNMLRICQYAGKTCWQSHEITKSTPNNFIKTLVDVGHESVIEHGNIILKADKKDYSAGTILRAIQGISDEPEKYADRAKITAIIVEETDDFWFFGMNIRGLKNLIRTAPSNNALRKDAIQYIVPKIESGFFSDFIKQGIIEPYMNIEGEEIPYFSMDRRDSFYIMSDMKELEDIQRELLLIPGMTLEKASKLVTMSIKFVLPRFSATQMIRHRSAVSQESLRYCDASNFKAFMPPSLKDKTFSVARHVIDNAVPDSCQETLNFSYTDLMEFIRVIYAQGRSNDGIAKEDMRDILPMSTLSEIVFTKSLAQWAHTLSLRVEKHTQLYPTRAVMSQLYLSIADGGYPLTNKSLGNLKELVVYEDLYNVNKR